MPRFLRRLRARIKYWNYESDLARELDVHREMAREAHAGRGHDSRRAAALQLGNTTLVTEEIRAMWIPGVLQQILQDARYAARGFRREWSFTLAAVLMLALGLGLALGSFTFLNGALLRGWP